MDQNFGAEEVLDYTVPEWYRVSKMFDIVFEALGKLQTMEWKTLLKKGGKFCSTKSLTFEKTAYLTFVERMILTGGLKPVIEKVFSFEQLVKAHWYVDCGHKKGNVIISHRAIH